MTAHPAAPPGQHSTQVARAICDLLQCHRPPHQSPPCRLLLISNNPDTPQTLRLRPHLTAAGHEVRHHTPEEARAAAAASADRWQGLLFPDGLCDLDPFELFDLSDSSGWLSHLLDASGELLIAAPFRPPCTTHAAHPPPNLPVLDYFLRLAGRCGFALLSQRSLGNAAPPTASGENDQGALFLLHLRRQQPPRWWPGRMNAAHQDEMRTLFATVFGHDMSQAHWQWKYGDGRGVGIGVWQNEQPAQSPPRLIAHYGGISRDICYFGQPARALQCCDVMVADRGRATLSRHGPLFLATATCLEHDLGYGTPHLVGFGFPNLRAYRLPEKLGLYAPVGRMVDVCWPALNQRPGLRLAVRPLNIDDPRSDERMNACWAAMQASLDTYIVGVRDARYLRHRYFAHPDKTYQCYIVQHRFSGAPLGLLVLRLQDKDGPGGAAPHAELLDLIGPRTALPVLIHHARRIAARQGCADLHAWLSDNLIPLLQLPPEASITDLAIHIPANVWSAGPDIATQRDRWWLTGGDTDFR
ncbi:MAG: hypothetical protein KBD39_05060 [Sterolibacterium sp.]|nr:hypothetical protein [Sterolibacterium sp.]